MKKLLLLCSFFACIAGYGVAQDASKFRRFSAGIYAGPQLYGKVFSHNKLAKISGITAGIDLSYAFSNQPEGFSLHFQPGYNTFRHFTSEGANTQIYIETTSKWGAIHLPLLARYTFGSGGIRPFAEAGPMLRLRTALKTRHAGTGCGVAGCSGIVINEDLQQQVSKDLVGMTAGAGVEVDLWKVTIPISVRIQEGFGTSESQVVLYDGPYIEKLKTRTIQVTAGINF
ncbi:hypothetical protein DYBT9623_00589 [Dyadobacter sp. CECT 9623]|uniref:Outer membrane protein beta-barrel domain-containing protein n=1 Tax=Dyadobacter linearis TaxID=2823330 RepID=A0ABM8UK47_9BACT|nr:outer membrane beta-barrel protein [Dyadobacter sp. CECT 9623]CAG5067862.1 hypothetical protein DYBT9623_00589 [Dyadobacter sp. CECT 9623]